MWILVILALASNAMACGKGSSEYRGDCVAEIQPETPPPVKPDNLKPPQTHNDPWRAEGVDIFNAPSLQEQDIKSDQEKVKAEEAGKKAAGL